MTVLDGLSKRIRSLESNLMRNDHDSVDKSVLIAQQDAKFGTNMYDAIKPADEPEIERLINKGFTRKGAILLIFEERYGKVEPTKAPSIRTPTPSVSTTLTDHKPKL